MDSITVIMTCHNRVDKTAACLKSIHDPDLDMRLVLVDDGCTDGTADAVRMIAEENGVPFEILQGDVFLFMNRF